MRLFAGDHFPRLALQSGDLPRPWVMPLGLPRSHRDRLTLLLAQALRALEPGLTLVQLRWAERHLFRAGRLQLPGSVLVWWRIDAIPAVDPNEVILDGSRLTPGLAVYDFDDRVDVPAQAWLGPLKMAVLHRITDRLLDDRPFAAHEEIADMLREMSAKLISPIDLLDAAEAMAEAAAQGESLDAARAEAVARVVAARFMDGPGPADAAARALVRVGRGEAVDADACKVLQGGGLMEGSVPMPLLDLLKDPDALQRTVLRLATGRTLETPLIELLSELSSIEQFAVGPALMNISTSFSPMQIGDGAKPPDLSKVSAPVLVQARLIFEGADDIEIAAQLVLQAIRRSEDRTWSSDDARAAGELLLAAANGLNDARGESQHQAILERIATMYEAAGGELERAGALQDAGRAFQQAGHLRRETKQWAVAEAMYQRGRALAEASGDSWGRANGLRGLAGAWCGLGRIREAIDAGKEAIALFRASRDRRGEAHALQAYGEACLSENEFDDAHVAFESARALFGELDDRISEIHVLLWLGRMHMANQELKSARWAFENALRISRKHNRRLYEAVALSLLAVLFVRNGEPLRALEFFEEALPLYRDLGDRSREADALRGVGLVRETLNDIPLAREAYGAARLIVHEIGDSASEAEVLSDIARLDGKAPPTD